jgi:tetratricopeptide (TPR) repeat protein
VTLVGVPGIGKSRLVYELMQTVEADEELIVWRQGRSLPYGEGVAFWALGEMVKAQAGILESDRADEAARKLREEVRELLPNEAEAGWVERHLRPLVGVARDPASGTERDDQAFAAWRRFLEALAERGPVVLVFEDLQWADDGLLDFVDELLDWLQGPMLVVCASRPELLERRPAWAGGKRNAVTLSLSPLSEEDTARLLAALLDRSALAAEIQSTLLARAAGNPLYAEEYARMLALGGGAELEVPETLQAIVSARIDALAPGEKVLIQTGAVLGKVFWTDALTAVAGEEAAGVAEALHGLERKEFVRRERRSAVLGEQQYAFLHVLIRDAAYAQLTRRERAEKHRRAADWLESLPADRSEDRAEMLAHHYRNALEYGRSSGRLDRRLERRAGRAFREAGDRALGLSAAEAAVHFYEGALDLEAGEPDPMLLFAHGRALSLLQRGERELARAAEALLAAGNAEAAAEAFCELSLAFWREGRIEDEEEQYLDKAYALVEDRPPSRAKAHVLAAVARGLAIAGNSDLAIERARAAIAIAEELGLDLVLGAALNNLGLAKSILGDRSGIADLERSLEITRDLDAFEAFRSYGNLSSTIFSFGDVRRAFEYHREALGVARRVGLINPIRWLVAEHVIDLYHLGRWDEALGHAYDFMASTETTPHYMAGLARMARAKILLGRGDSADALADIDQSLQLAREMKDPQIVYPTLASAARSFASLGRRERATATADELLGLLRSGGRDALADTWAIDFAVVMRAFGRESEVLDVLHPPTPWSDAAAAYANGAFDRAAELLREIGSLPDEAEARVRAAEVLAAAGRRSESDAQLERALAFYRRVGAEALMPEAERVPRAERRA